MTPVTTFAGRRVALFGLGGSGLATALALKAGGADVVAYDDSEASREKARAQGIAVADLRAEDWSRFTSLVLAPGVPLTHPAPHWTVGLAKAANVEIIGDIELFCRERAALAPDAPFVAITGTNGKSTTTALVAHILREAGLDVQMGGNIGTAILSLEPPSRERVHVVEMSSFQIDLTPSLAPSVACLLNITPDHLDRHGTMENYAAIKERVVAGSRRAFIGVDDPASAAIYERHSVPRIVQKGWISRTHASAYPVSVERKLDLGVFLDGTRIVLRHRSGSKTDAGLVLCDLAGINSLRGAHNAQNACFAAGVFEALEVVPDYDRTHLRQSIQAALRTFPGLAHRMEEVGRRGETIFVNDSKATNADSTEKALASFERVYWILGGKQKEGGIASLRPYFPRVAKAYLIGEASEAFAATLREEVPHVLCGTLDKAVAAAAADAAAAGEGERVVLLSPACASYDQYRNFEIRGDHFRDLVRALPA
ncbi:UDP-N-acetylmuramoyl-L-alanine--D-glutamate ligase [Enterovirga rhinocerotis]|uniref:UDP-N-acetylmuramoylalanine--D-glutamate ligase n=1 Tax=Enterovirga rhinocerotis TaxID=1339210 RepID=A0A4R7BU97_9HYPH|nr:UDP-N-acetylmuramoyl-L-alanine--D-glutamate ligase [Enterovirga rhinocerotis]TDR88155.1 UDP-N-acetylmuramoylalanine--D-glutamate ligase [Enterovirga rhinocerotis]